MMDFRNVRWTCISVILLIVSVQWSSSKAVYTGQIHKFNSILDSTVGGDNNDAMENSDVVAEASGLVEVHGSANHKHLKFLKSPNPNTVEKIKWRIKARMKGRKPDQSNERNLWTSHPKNLDWTGPDTFEVVGVINSLGI